MEEFKITYSSPTKGNKNLNRLKSKKTENIDESKLNKRPSITKEKLETADVELINEIALKKGEQSANMGIKIERPGSGETRLTRKKPCARDGHSACLFET